jgi:1-acyl-sn-glycerol-3-phosphate acyltransferase
VKRLTRVQVVWYDIVRNVVAGFCRLFWRLRVDGAEHVPLDGPFILAPVHRSNIDTPLVCAISGRRLRYMGKDAMWKYRWSAWFFTSLGGFPVRRGSADREALRSCLEVLAGGEPLVMFPEGTRQSGPLVDTLFDGAAYVAIRAGVPIVPVGIGGSEAAMPRGARMIRPVRVTMVVGPPMYPEPGGSGRASRRAVRQLTDRLAKELQGLYDEAQVKAGAGRPKKLGSLRFGIGRKRGTPPT